MQLKPGLRLKSLTCDGEFIVVRAPKAGDTNGDVDLRCGGQPIGTHDSTSEKTAPVAGMDGGALMGKRYANDELGLEVLVTKAAKGALSVGDELLPEKGAKLLPSSD